MSRHIEIANGGAVREICRLLVKHGKLSNMIKDRDVLAEALEEVEEEMQFFVDFMPELTEFPRTSDDLYVTNVGTCASVIDSKDRKKSVYVEVLNSEDPGYSEVILLVCKPKKK